MKTGRLLKVLVVSLGGIIIFMPLFLKNSIYSLIAASSDMKAHTAIMDATASGGQMPTTLYPAQKIVGIPLGMISSITGVTSFTLYLLLCFTTLFLVAFTLYFVVSKLVGKQAGWLVIPIALLCTQSILALFSYGVIFSVINMYIVLPFAVFFAVKWLVSKKSLYLVFAVLLFSFFSIFHVTSLYLPYVAGLALILIVGAKLLWKVKGKQLAIKRPILLSSGILVLNLVLSSIALPRFSPLAKAPVISTAEGFSVSLTSSNYVPPTFGNFTVNFLSVATMALVILAIVGLVILWKGLNIKPETKIFVFTLGCFACALGGGTFLDLSPDPVRTALDFSAMLAIIVAIVLGVLLHGVGVKYQKARPFAVFAVFAVIAAGMAPTLSTWVSAGGTT